MVKQKDKNKEPPPQIGGENIVINACLCYIHSLMMNRNKFIIEEKTVSSFNLQALKEARELLFKHLEPDGPKYQGPNRSTERQKMIHAFESIYKKMSEVDAATSQVIFVCPSYELSLIPQLSSDNNHIKCSDKLNQIQAVLQQQIDEIKTTFHSYSAKVVGTADSAPSLGAMKMSTPIFGRTRRDSMKRKLSPAPIDSLEKSTYVDAASSVETPNMDSGDRGFTYQRDYRRKIARLESKTDSPVNVAAPSVAAPSAPAKSRFTQNKRPDVVWGTVESSPTGIKGVPPKPRFVPDVFLSRFDPVDTTEEKVKFYLIKQGVNVSEVKRVSHDDAPFKNFRVSVEKREDFNKLMSGDFVPQFVSVKKFWIPRSERGNFNPGFYRGQPSASSEYDKCVHELAELESAATGSHSAVAMDTASLPPRDAVQKTVSLINAVTAASALQTKGLGNDVDTRTPAVNE